MACGIRKHFESAFINRTVISREFHRRANTITRWQRRDCDAMLFKNQRILWTDAGSRHRDRISFAWLNRNATAKQLIPFGCPRSGRRDELSARNFALGGLAQRRAWPRSTTNSSHAQFSMIRTPRANETRLISAINRSGRNGCRSDNTMPLPIPA